MIATFFDFLTI